MKPFRELARAKINLTLEVCGRRADGYHEIESLVAFADFADEVAFHPGAELRVDTTGPFAAEIVGENLVHVALRRLRGLGLLLGSVSLVKNLPVAAGLGGGSADAAAVLRAVRAASPELAAAVDWNGLARGLGADVPVCLAGKVAWMSGIGERIEPLAPGFPGLALVLVNPRQPLSTAAVFAALQAGPVPTDRRHEDPARHRGLVDMEQLLEFVCARGNDLELPATALLPVVAEVKAAIARQAGCRHAALSGSGPTCFGIFADDAAAAQAAAALRALHPGWWVVATRLAGR